MSNALGPRGWLWLAACSALLAAGGGGCSEAASQGSAPYGGSSAAGSSGGQVGTGGAQGGFGGTAGQGGSTGRRSTGNTALPCEVDKAVRRNCQSCHAALPLSGVPMALVTWEDFQQRAVTNSNIEVHRLADQRIHDAARPMPPPPQMLPMEDKTALEQWLSAGAPSGAGCGTGGAGGTGGGGGASGTGGSSGSAGTGGTGGAPPDQGQCYELLAHAASNKTNPYGVTREEYVNFYFDAPWPADAQGVSFETIFDNNPQIVHHWLLYIAGSGGYLQPDGTVEPNANGSHAGATLVAGWAPGGNNGTNLPADVGLDINGQTRKVVLELHYYATGSFTSRSGVKVCTTKTPRKNLATVSWLGTENVYIPARSTATASGTCAPSTNQQIHILRSWPHMHKIGTHMKTVITRAGGATETLLDEPFNFNTQISYDTVTVLNPGDRLTTTCTYKNDSSAPVRYGINTSNEMCFNFVTAWPANLLKSGTHTGGVQNPCLN